MLSESTKRTATLALFGAGALLLLVSFAVAWGVSETPASLAPFFKSTFEIKPASADWQISASGFGTFSQSGTCDWYGEPDTKLGGENPCKAADGQSLQFFLLQASPFVLGLAIIASLMAVMLPLSGIVANIPGRDFWARVQFPAAVTSGILALIAVLLTSMNAEIALEYVSRMAAEGDATTSWGSGLIVPILGILAVVSGAVLTKIPAVEDPVSRTSRLSADDDYDDEDDDVRDDERDDDVVPARRGTGARPSFLTGGRADRASPSAYRADYDAETEAPRAAPSRAASPRASPDPYGSAPPVARGVPVQEQATDPYGAPLVRPGEAIKTLQCPQCRGRFDAPARRPLFVKCPDCGKSALLHQ